MADTTGPALPSKPDMAAFARAVRFRERAVQAALEHFVRIDMYPESMYARAAFDAMEGLIREDERERLAEASRLMPAEPIEEMTEALSEAVHVAWMETKTQQGVTSRRSEWGEEQMVPYRDLSERAKDLDRGTVRGVLAAIDRAGYRISRA
ncbi:hypothetical protein DKT68_15355 [Micromonospora acroterricola]|uniref:Ryanodine receptor Ryr domain-containing protein n=1 Tax=Micromonospora acroterricola TaxID=2202421 RepID=A0A317D156_9ACTN|nr:RyR domain-containing protein [Micromonospora acroterricola]PWR08591.1 hypothetical protein DKT68_15355 [Micromonospora acroterricola]